MYIRTDLTRFAPDVFQWEHVLHARLHGAAPAPIRAIMFLGEVSFPVILATTAPAVAAALLADLWVSGDRSTELIASGYVGAAATVAVGVMAGVLTVYHESRRGG